MTRLQTHNRFVDEEVHWRLRGGWTGWICFKSGNMFWSFFLLRTGWFSLGLLEYQAGVGKTLWVTLLFNHICSSISCLECASSLYVPQCLVLFKLGSSSYRSGILSLVQKGKGLKGWKVLKRKWRGLSSWIISRKQEAWLGLRTLGYCLQPPLSWTLCRGHLYGALGAYSDLGPNLACYWTLSCGSLNVKASLLDPRCSLGLLLENIKLTSLNQTSLSLYSS